MEKVNYAKRNKEYLNCFLKLLFIWAEVNQIRWPIMHNFVTFQGHRQTIFACSADMLTTGQKRPAGGWVVGYKDGARLHTDDLSSSFTRLHWHCLLLQFCVCPCWLVSPLLYYVTVKYDFTHHSHDQAGLLPCLQRFWRKQASTCAEELYSMWKLVYGVLIEIIQMRFLQ